MTASINPPAMTTTVLRAIRVDPARGAHADKAITRGATPEVLPAGRSLVPVDGALSHPPDRGIALRPAARHAGFYAHLIATDARVPQTCARRRIAPQDGALAYRTAGAAPAREAPRMLRTA